MVGQKPGDKANSSASLKIFMLLPEPYNLDMPARPEVMEIYGNCFPRLGHKVTWVMPAKGNVKEIEEEAFGDVRIFTIPHYAGSFLPKRVFAKLVFLWKEEELLGKIVKKGEKGGIIQVRNSVFEGILAIYLKRKFKIPFVFQYSFPGAEGSLWKYKSGSGKFYYLMARLVHFMLPFVMHRANLILPISGGMMENLGNRGIPTTKMMALSMGVNIESFSPSVGAERVQAKYSLSDSKVIIYLGTMDRLRQLDMLIHSLAQLKWARQNVKLLMVGDGDGRNNLERLVCDLELKNTVIFVGQVPYFEVPEFIAAADVAVSPVPPLDIYKVSSPCKLFEYMGIAKPVIANEEIPEHREVLEESGGGVLVPFTSEAFAQAIIELLDNPERAAEMGKRGREWVVKNRSYEILARQVEKRYRELIAISSP
ncbi:D-inositol-3-phosphate glycosyltransferase [subsurface metagenome]